MSHKSDHPMLIVIFGLPGTGKTTFAETLSQHLGIGHFNTDRVRNLMDKRKQYDEENKALVYDKMLSLTKSEIEKGKNVIVDGTFYKKKLRTRLMELAKQYDASVKWIQVCADEEVVKERITKERRYSEADYAVYQKIKTKFEPMEEEYLQLFSDLEETPDMVKKAIKFIEQ